MTIFTTYSGPFGRTGTQTVQHHSNSPRLVLPDCRGTIPTKVSYQGPLRVRQAARLRGPDPGRTT